MMEMELHLKDVDDRKEPLLLGSMSLGMMSIFYKAQLWGRGICWGSVHGYAVERHLSSLIFVSLAFLNTINWP